MKLQASHEEASTLRAAAAASAAAGVWAEQREREAAEAEELRYELRVANAELSELRAAAAVAQEAAKKLGASRPEEFMGRKLEDLPQFGVASIELVRRNT